MFPTTHDALKRIVMTDFNHMKARMAFSLTAQRVTEWKPYLSLLKLVDAQDRDFSTKQFEELARIIGRHLKDSENLMPGYNSRANSNVIEQAKSILLQMMQQHIKVISANPVEKQTCLKRIQSFYQHILSVIADKQERPTDYAMLVVQYFSVWGEGSDTGSLTAIAKTKPSKAMVNLSDYIQKVMILVQPKQVDSNRRNYMLNRYLTMYIRHENAIFSYALATLPYYDFLCPETGYQQSLDRKDIEKGSTNWLFNYQKVA